MYTYRPNCILDYYLGHNLDLRASLAGTTTVYNMRLVCANLYGNIKRNNCSPSLWTFQQNLDNLVNIKPTK